MSPSQIKMRQSCYNLMVSLKPLIALPHTSSPRLARPALTQKESGRTSLIIVSEGGHVETGSQREL